MRWREEQLYFYSLVSALINIPSHGSQGPGQNRREPQRGRAGRQMSSLVQASADSPSAGHGPHGPLHPTLCVQLGGRNLPARAEGDLGMVLPPSLLRESLLLHIPASGEEELPMPTLLSFQFPAELSLVSPSPCAVTCHGLGDRKLLFAFHDSCCREHTLPWGARCRLDKSCYAELQDGMSVARNVRLFSAGCLAVPLNEFQVKLAPAIQLRCCQAGGLSPRASSTQTLSSAAPQPGQHLS